MLFYNESPRQRHTETCLLKKSVIIYSPSNTAVGEAYKEVTLFEEVQAVL